jgi:hypothetical protein
MTFIDHLERLAQAATPGPWINSQDASTPEYSAVSSRAKSCGVALCEEDSDAAYIAALSPERVLALIKCVRAADILVGMERAAKIAANLYPPKHSFASENAELYRAQDETRRAIAAASRRAMKEE